MKLILNNTELELYDMPTSKSLFMNNSNRNAIEFHFDRAKYGSDEIFNALSSESNTEVLRIAETNAVNNEEAAENVYTYTNYCIVSEMSVKDIIIENETPEKEAVKEKVISVTLARLTYSELQQKNVRKQIEELTEQNLMLMEAMAEIYETQLEE